VALFTKTSKRFSNFTTNIRPKNRSKKQQKKKIVMPTKQQNTKKRKNIARKEELIFQILKNYKLTQ
jgi:hypothetical protein